MNNFVIFPIIVPLFTGILCIFLRDRLGWLRGISLLATIINLVIAGLLIRTVSMQGIQTLTVGNWPAPYGIVLVSDLFSLLLVTAANLVVFACILFAIRSLGEAREKSYFYAFVMFLLTGVSGAFLTGDIFNLFVFFEVMLISSYALITLGGERAQLRESFKYLIINIISSTLFVIAVGYLYAVVGTLNMADLAVKISEAGQPGILTAIAMLFFFVFGMKGALFPLYYWLPGSYTKPPAVIGALLGGLLTKVGAYAIYRVFTLIFVQDIAFTHWILLIVAALTMIAGSIGAVGSHDIRYILAYNIIIAIGFMVMGVGLYNETSVSGGAYYMIQDMVIKAALFMLIGITIEVAGTSDLRQMGGLLHAHPVLGWLIFLSSLALAGIPPLSGFIGKLQLIEGGIQAKAYVIVGISLFSSLMILYSTIRIFIYGFWGEQRRRPEETHDTESYPGKQLASSFNGRFSTNERDHTTEAHTSIMNTYSLTEGATSLPPHGKKPSLLAPAFLMALVIFMGIGAETLVPYVTEAGDQMIETDDYIHAVLKE